MNKEKEFWNWFISHSKTYSDLDNIVESKTKDEVLNLLREKIHDYNPNLYYEIEEDPNARILNLIITAAGNSKYFSNAEELVMNSPKIFGWNVIALKPPMGATFITNYEGLSFNPKEMWFQPLENKSFPEQIGVNLCTPNFNSFEEKKEQLKGALEIVVESVIGERSFSCDINYFGITNMPVNPIEEGFIELADYINWKKKSRR